MLVLVLFDGDSSRSWPFKQNQEVQLQSRGSNRWHCLRSQILLCVGCSATAFAAPSPPLSPTNIFAPASTPAKSIFGLSLFVLAVTGAIFLVVFTLLLYSVVKFRKRKNDDGREPPQVYGSNQVELAWTVIPVLIVVALFMATARVIASVQKTAGPENAIEVIAIGHQFWWEYRYPALGVITANELHVPASDDNSPTPTLITLLSADTDHSFWVPRLAGKTDLIPNHPNSMWIDPHEIGVYLGQCAQYCGTQHAKMLLRVYVQSRRDFDRWAQQQARPSLLGNGASAGTAHFRDDRLHQLSHRDWDRSPWPLRARPDALDEQRHDCRRSSDQHARTLTAMDSKSRRH